MIVKIEPAKPSCRSALDYNEGKVLMGVAELVGYANMDRTDQESIYQTFDRYERSRYYIRQMSFHASVNPSVEDHCTEDQVLEFISGLMQHLGYGNQPYLVYRHFDIEREHYHIVSVRADRTGRKIKNYYDFHRAHEYMASVSEQYGFTLARSGCRRESIEGDTKPKVTRFNPKKEVRSQLGALFDKALTYDFETIPQLQCVLRDLGVEATVERLNGSASFTFQGLDRCGRPVSHPLDEEKIGRPLYSEAVSCITENRKSHSGRAREKERVRSLVGFAFDFSKSESHFVNILRNKGIGVHFSRREGTGEAFGVTFVDHRTLSVFKGSEMRDIISIQKMSEAVASGRWRVEDRGGRRSAYVRSSRASAREDAVRLRDLHAGVVARVLRPVGQPRGNSWSGKPKPTREQQQAQWDAESTGGVNASFEDTRFIEKIL